MYVEELEAECEKLKRKLKEKEDELRSAKVISLKVYDAS